MSNQQEIETQLLNQARQALATNDPRSAQHSLREFFSLHSTDRDHISTARELLERLSLDNQHSISNNDVSNLMTSILDGKASVDKRLEDAERLYAVARDAEQAMATRLTVHLNALWTCFIAIPISDTKQHALRLCIANLVLLIVNGSHVAASQLFALLTTTNINKAISLSAWPSSIQMARAMEAALTDGCTQKGNLALRLAFIAALAPITLQKDDTNKLDVYRVLLKLVSVQDNEQDDLALAIYQSKGLVSMLDACAQENSTELQATARLCLSRMLSLVPSSKKGRDPLKKYMVNAVESLLDSTVQKEREKGLVALACVFSCAPDLGAAIALQEGWMHALMDTIEFESQEYHHKALEMLSAACADHDTRKLLSIECISFLQSCIRQEDSHLATLAATVLAKLQQSAEVHREGNAAPARPPKPTQDVSNILEAKEVEQDARTGLTQDFILIVKNYKHADANELANAVEGLAFYSITPFIRTAIAQDDMLLKACMDLAQTTSDGSIRYGIVAILDNITQHKSTLTREQKELVKLRNMATAAEGKPTIDEDPFEEEEVVLERCKALLKAGVMKTLQLCARLDHATNVHLCAAHILHSLTLDATNRGILLQFGAVKVLLQLHTKLEDVQARAIVAQAIAKLAITTDPRIAFPGAQLFDIVPLLVSLCTDKLSETVLQQFEALLALTNLAGVSDDVRQCILDKGGFGRAEYLMLSEIPEIRRSATELVCNMVFLPQIAEMYASDKDGHRVKLLGALVNSEDTATSSAASAALAILAGFGVDELSVRIASNPVVIASIRERLEDEDEQPEVKVRLVECIRCLVACKNTTVIQIIVQSELAALLVRIVQKQQDDESILLPAIDALKTLSSLGIPLPM
jgi:hypothetical protein